MENCDARAELKGYTDDVCFLAENERQVDILLRKLENAKNIVQKKLNEEALEIEAQCFEISRELLNVTKRLCLRKAIIDKALEKVSEPYRRILLLIYVCGHNLEKTAEEMGYSYTYTSELHNRALKIYEQCKNG